MCHSLAFDRQGGTLRTLRHGEPGQVVADLRDFYRARPAGAAASLSGMARRPPGDGALANSRIRFAAASHAPGQAERAIRAVFSPGGACYDCHEVVAPGDNSLNYGIRPVAFPVRYMHKGWFDHKPHVTEDCATCHEAGKSDAASDLLLPDLKTCRTCHAGESATKAQVPSSCAMCHDYHQDQGQPAMLVRQQVRGKKRDTAVQVTAGARNPLGAGSR
jgi:predicted CXXCH cytochrome family protein